MQFDLFTAAVVIPSHAPVDMRPRLGKQCAAILARLEAGPATNRELSQIALNYKARASELRQAGYGVVCYNHDKRTGLSWYRLEAR